MQAIRSASLVPCIALLLTQIDRSLYFKSIAKVADGLSKSTVCASQFSCGVDELSLLHVI